MALGAPFIRRAAKVLDHMDPVRVSSEILQGADRLEPASLRSLYAMFRTTAALFADALSGVVTCDQQMFDAADKYGWNVRAPS